MTDSKHLPNVLYIPHPVQQCFILKQNFYIKVLFIHQLKHQWVVLKEY